MQLYIEQMPIEEQIVLAGDHTAWSRPEAVILQERTTEHYTTGIGGNRPITQGQGYSTIAWIPETQGSWALPLRHERLPVGNHQLRKQYGNYLKFVNIYRSDQFLCGIASMVVLLLS